MYIDRLIERGASCAYGPQISHILFFVRKIGKLVYATPLTDTMDIVAGIVDNVATIQIQESAVDERVK